MPDYVEVFQHLHRAPSMWVFQPSYASLTSFVQGFDAALEGAVLQGFREWLVVKNDGGNNLAWPALVPCIAFPEARDPIQDPIQVATATPESERVAIDTFFSLFDEFTRIREDQVRGGLRRIYLEYEGWLRRQEWYGPNSPDFLG